jgi:proton-coupled amino acid transporter
VAADIIWSAIVSSSKYLQSLKELSTNPAPLTLNSSWLTATRKFSLIQNFVRILLVVFTFLLAFSIPKIDLFISLVGAVGSSTLALIIPPILDQVVFWPEKKSTAKLVKNGLICFFGIYIFLAGTLVSIENIIDYFMGN